MFGMNKWIYSGYLISSLLFLHTSVNIAAEEVNGSPAPDAYVARAQFTSAVVNREPVDEVMKLDAEADRIFFFTELRNLQGQTVTHRWEFEGQVLSEVEFAVGGPRWRVYSAKTLNPGEPGKWTVFVIDESGWPLHASMFEHEDATDR